jgi:sarcosine oxidase subunit gamma
MSEITQESPLVQCKRLSFSTAPPEEAAGVWLGERAFLGHINLRGNAAERAYMEAIGRVIGLDLPVAPNTAAAGATRVLCWLGPDEWLLQTPPGEQQALIAQLRQALAGQFAAVTDLSSGQTTLTVQGPRARDVLAKGCPLDLHPRAFGPEQCAQTLLAKATVLLRPVAADSFEVTVRRSFADYLWQWLADAGGEYGVALVDQQSAAVQAAENHLN